MPDDVIYNSPHRAYYYNCKVCGSINSYPETSAVEAANGWCGTCKCWRDSNSLLWKCDDGRYIHLKNMETSHIQNCVGMIMHRSNWRQRYMEPLLLELKRRQGDESQRDDRAAEAGQS